MSILSSLSTDEKLDLISKLTESLRRKKKIVAKAEDDDVFAAFNMDWGGDDSPNQIADKLRDNRFFEREIEEW